MRFIMWCRSRLIRNSVKIMLFSLTVSSCTVSPPIRVVDIDTEVKDKFGKRVSISYFYATEAIGSIDDRNVIRSKTISQKNANKGRISFGVKCQIKNVHKIRSVRYWSNGRTSHGPWKEVEEPPMPCSNSEILDYTKISAPDFKIKEVRFEKEGICDVARNNKVPCKVFNFEFTPKSEHALFLKSGEAPKTFEDLSLTKGLALELEPKNVKVAVSPRGGSIVEKGDSLQWRFQLQVANFDNASKKIASIIKEQNFKNIWIETLNIDSQYPFNGSRVTFTGTPPSLDEIVGRYVVDRQLKLRVIEKLTFSYVQGSVCCKQSAFVYYPFEYAVKVIHPKYYAETQNIDVRSSSKNFDILLSEIGTKQRVQIIEY